MPDLRYPIGPFRAPGPLDAAQRRDALASIAACPAEVRRAVAGLTDAQLDTPYRPGGWTVRQVVHHVPDSHMNAYVRFKLAMTEDEPTIRPYDQDRWAQLPDAREPIAASLDLLDALHRRWVRLMESVPAAAWERRFTHPEMGVLRLDTLLALYDWHGRHHVAHVTSLRSRNGW
jgi:hypothetical protein